MAAIRLSHLTKRYDNGFTAVANIDLTIADREFMVLVGPSGCGKTTTLRMIAGLEDVTEGEIHIGPRLVNDMEPKDRDIAMVFQNYALYPHMTVYDNMAYGLKLRHVDKATIDAQVKSVAKQLGLSDQLSKRPKQLSGGQRQRVALGRAIVRQPQVFLFDEPLSNLDAKLRNDMRYELKELQQRVRTTMVYVTHDQVEAMTLGDRITVMANGTIQQVATPSVLYDQPANRFVAEFIGTPSINAITGTIHQTDGKWFLLHADQRVPLLMAGHEQLTNVSGEVVLGVRPEHLSLASDATDPDAMIVPMQVHVVEHMGDHQYVYLHSALNHEPLTMKCSTHRQLRSGESIEVALSTVQAHVFAGTDEFAVNCTRIPADQ